MKFVVAALALVSAVNAKMFRAGAKLNAQMAGRVSQKMQDYCGRGFDALNGGSQDYLMSTKDHLFSHGGVRNEAWSVFENEIKCWYSRIVSDKCGKLPPVPGRKEALYAACTDDTVVANDIKVTVGKPDGLITQAEYKYIRSFFPDQEDGDYSEAMKTAKEMAEKEFLCLSLFTIDDECVAHKYMKTA